MLPLKSDGGVVCIVLLVHVILFRGCRRQPLYYFHFNFRYVTLDIYIYISTCNQNNEFILKFTLHETKMADFECRQLEIQLEFVR